jgi:hypothetical protein
MLGQVKSQLSTIETLTSKPSKIVLSNYTSRDLGDQTWHFSLSNTNNDEVSKFLTAEKTLQAIEQKLFAGKVFLFKPSIGGQAERLDEQELAKATATLDKLASQINQAAIDGSIKILKLELGTNRTSNPAFLDYSPQFKMIEIPYEADAEALSYFITTVVPSSHKLQQSLAKPVDFSSVQSRFFYQSLTDFNLRQFKARCDALASIFNGFDSVSAKIKDVTTLSNSRRIELVSSTGQLIITKPTHGIVGQAETSALRIFALHMDEPYLPF